MHKLQFLRDFQNAQQIIDDDPAFGRGALWLGDFASAKDQKFLKQKKIKTVLTTAQGLNITFVAAQEITHFSYPMLELETYNIYQHFQDTFQVIDEGLDKGSMLVHCAAGESRSATIVIAYIMKKYGYSYLQAYNYVKRKRKAACPNYGFAKQLRSYERYLQSTNQLKMQEIPQKSIARRSSLVDPLKRDIQKSADNENTVFNGKSEVYKSSMTSRQPSNKALYPQLSNKNNKTITTQNKKKYLQSSTTNLLKKNKSYDAYYDASLNINLNNKFSKKLSPSKYHFDQTQYEQLQQYARRFKCQGLQIDEMLYKQPYQQQQFMSNGIGQSLMNSQKTESVFEQQLPTLISPKSFQSLQYLFSSGSQAKNKSHYLPSHDIYTINQGFSNGQLSSQQNQSNHKKFQY